MMMIRTFLVKNYCTLLSHLTILLVCLRMQGHKSRVRRNVYPNNQNKPAFPKVQFIK